MLHIKKNAAGEIDKYRARVVVKGFTQIHRVDYYETYALVAKLASFRLLLTIAARNGWPADTFDFDSAYLNNVLEEDEIIYLEQPVGYETANQKDWVWRLLKALYGLKQGARSWYQALCKVLNELGFTRSEADHGVFFKEVGKDIVILAVHVNDGMIPGSHISLISEFKEDMNAIYKLTDMGQLIGSSASR